MSSILCSILLAFATVAATAVGASAARTGPAATATATATATGSGAAGSPGFHALTVGALTVGARAFEHGGLAGDPASPPTNQPTNQPGGPPEGGGDSESAPLGVLSQETIEPLPMSALELELRDLVGLDAEALELHLAESPPEDRDSQHRALIALAGQSASPGFPAAWGQRRESERAPARDYLRARLDDPRSGAGWRILLRDILEDPTVAPALWSAAARLVAELSLFELTPALAAALDVPRFAAPDSETEEGILVRPAMTRRAIARRALHGLYRRWFETEENVRPLYAEVDQFRENDVFRRTLIEMDRVALDRLRRLVELRPSDANSRLSDPDPRVKAHAATTVARAVGEQVTDPDEAIQLLLAELAANVHDAWVFHAVLESLIEILASAPPDSEPLRRLRLILESILDSGAPSGVRTSIASGLTRLPWGASDAAPGDGAETGLRMLAGMIQRLAVWSSLRDDDEIVFVLQSLLSLGGRASANGLDVRASVGYLGTPLAALFRDGGLKSDVRSASGRALATFVPLTDLGRLVADLGGPEGRTVPRLELLGALQRIGPELEVDSVGATRLTEVLVEALRDEDGYVRRRALDVLRDPKLAKHTSRVPVSTWLGLLEDESVPTLSLGLIDLVKLSGNPAEHLDEVWNSPSFERTATEDSRVFGGFALLLREWCRGSVEHVSEVSMHLLDLDDIRLRPARLAATLQLAADLEPADAALYEKSHACELLERATELRRTDHSALLAITTKAGRPYIERLVRNELLDRCTAESEDGVSYANLRIAALLSADLWSVDPEALSEDLVVSRFAAAASRVALPGGPPGGPTTSLGESSDLESWRPGAELLRERARFYAAAGRDSLARSDFVKVFQFDERLPQGAARLLSNADLRRAAELQRAAALEARLRPVVSRAGDVAPPGGDRLLGTAADFLDAVLARPAWAQESAEARFGDLRLRLELAAESGSASEIARLLELLKVLPGLPLSGPSPEAPSETSTAGPGEGDPDASPAVHAALEGLVEEYDWLLQFHTSRARLEDRARQLAEQDAAGVQPAGFEPDASTETPAVGPEPAEAPRPEDGALEEPGPVPSEETPPDSDSEGSQG